jgi:hypothetical protein
MHVMRAKSRKLHLERFLNISNIFGIAKEQWKCKNEVLPGIEPGLPEDTDANQNPE